MRIVTFDIETANWFGEGVEDMKDLQIALVGIHDSETDSYQSFLEPELPQLWPILERTDILVGWNSDHFDVPLLNKYYPGDLTKIKSLDLMMEIYNSLGRRLRLDAVADGTLNDKKLDGKGGQSVIWWRAGEVEKVREYCLHDVKLTKKILDHALKNNSVKYKELGAVREIKLDTSQWLAPKTAPMTFTLGL
ncbi:MAG TPA: ribonuclease H-like domain-containing protein [Candidatus Paceibacterota bacterium]|nr:ribonuclease H-like domain-containing protein [Candidatus Paceibacterota bacterium]